MSEFKELVKSFAKSREYVRDFFVYGFKTREDFKNKSARTYDNERRRLESWLAGYVRQDYAKQGKNISHGKAISLAIDSNLLETNPLYRVWKTKSFTDNDILLHFFLLDYLKNISSDTADGITDALLLKYDTLFDVQTVRRKCNDYVKEGLLRKEKQGKEVHYRLEPDYIDAFEKYPNLGNAISYFQLVSPLGIVGSTIMDTMDLSNNCFRVKHGFCVHTLEDEVLLQILSAMHEKRTVTLYNMNAGVRENTVVCCTPLQIFVSTRSGRRYLCVYLQRSRFFQAFRLDHIKKLDILDPAPDYDEKKEQLLNNHSRLWGVSFQNKRRRHTHWIKMTLFIQEPNEQYILTRLQSESRGGTITRLRRNIYTYEREVFDVNEMLPWIRTFTGRIVELSSNCEPLLQRFRKDLEEMYEMYGITKER